MANLKSSNKFYKKYNMKKVLTVIIILILIVILILVNLKKDVNENTNMLKLNLNKYSTKIKKEYEKNNENLEKVNKFITTQNSLQADIYNYFYSQDDLEDENKKQSIINEKLKENNLYGISNVDITYWRGTWFCDEYGNLKFKFASKKIEPSWIQNKRLEGYIEKN